jgi:hypothetical protein
MGPLGFWKQTNKQITSISALPFNRKSILSADKINDIAESKLSKLMDLFGYVEYV